MISAVPTSKKLFHYRNEDNRNIVNTHYLAKKIFCLIWNAIGQTIQNEQLQIWCGNENASGVLDFKTP